MQVKYQKHSINSIFILLLLLLFTVFAVLIIAFGSRVYEEAANCQDYGFSYRTSFAYLTEKIRQSEEDGFFDLMQKEQTHVLCLYSELEGERYVTYLYEYEGYLREYFTSVNLDFSLDQGQKICEISQLTFQLEDSLLHISFLDASNQSHTLKLYLHQLEAGNGNF